MTRTLFSRLFAAACLPLFLFLFAAAHAAEKPVPVGPSYIRLDMGWVGFWPHGGEYVEFRIGGDAKLSDAYHVMLNPGQGMMMTFADKKEFAPSKSLLEAHQKWELDYWRKNVSSLEFKNRDDLAGPRHDLMVTEIDLPQKDGSPMRAYMIGVAATHGVFVFSISPIVQGDDATIRTIIESIKVEHKKLDIAAEAKRLAPEDKAAAGGKKQ